MKNITQWVGVLCISCYVMGLLLNLVQLSHTQKVTRLLVAMFIIITIFRPFSQKDFFSLDGYEYTSQDYNISVALNAVDTIIKQAQKNLEQTIKSQLDQQNLCYENIFVHIYEENGSLNINSVEIQGVLDEEKNAIYKALSNIVAQDKIILGG